MDSVPAVEEQGMPATVELGPAVEPPLGRKLRGRRLPQQLADFRLQLRVMASYCDRMQGTTAPAVESSANAEVAMEGLQAEHAAAMNHARQCLRGPPRRPSL